MRLLSLFKKNNNRSTYTSLTTPKNQWEQRIENLQEVYGSDARKIIFNKNFNLLFFKKFESALYLRDLDSTASYQIEFSKRNPVSFPGPFYTLEIENSKTGQTEAPNNILCDGEGHECVFMQPRSTKELSNVLSAALHDPFGSYAINGNEHWNLVHIRSWWKNRNKLIDTLRSIDFERNNNGQNLRYIDYLNGDAKLDLQRYAYFLDKGCYPTEDITDLPIID